MGLILLGIPLLISDSMVNHQTHTQKKQIGEVAYVYSSKHISNYTLVIDKEVNNTPYSPSSPL